MDVIIPQQDKTIVIFKLMHCLKITFSKLWTFPWKIFTHLSLGANGRISQTRTKSHWRDNLKEALRQYFSLTLWSCIFLSYILKAATHHCCPWSWTVNRILQNWDWGPSLSLRVPACCKWAYSASGPIPAVHTHTYKQIKLHYLQTQPKAVCDVSDVLPWCHCRCLLRWSGHWCHWR